MIFKQIHAYNTKTKNLINDIFPYLEEINKTIFFLLKNDIIEINS